MKPLFQTRMLNGPFEDPVLYLDFLFEKRALLFDLGNIRSLSPRQLLRVSDIFVSHTHMDHFADFDWLLRLCLGRDKQLRLFGPPGFIDRVEHKLGAYTWNLVTNYETDLSLLVTELHADQTGRRAVFPCREAFPRRDERRLALPEGVLVDETALRVRAAVLDHGTPCLGFAAEEKQHVNLWKNRLLEMGLAIGPWLRHLKQAVLEQQSDDTPIQVEWQREQPGQPGHLSLGELRARVVRTVPGQKIGYVVDVAYNPDNARRIVELVKDSHTLFIEAVFLDSEAAAAGKCHLTARQAGLLGREACVKELVPIHFSPRYAGREQVLRQEAKAAFLGGNDYSVA